MTKHLELGEGVGPRADIVKGMARAMFVDWWANEEERKREDDRSYKLPWGAGDDVMDFAPKTSRNAMRKAGELATTIERLNKSDLPAMFDKAQAEGFDDDPEKFGHYLAMQSLGHGVSWDDDLRTDVEFKLPHVEYYESIDEGRLDEVDPVLAIGAIGSLAVGGAIGAAVVKAWRTIKSALAVGKKSDAEAAYEQLSKDGKRTLAQLARERAKRDTARAGRAKPAMREGLDEYTGEWPSSLPIPSDSLTPGVDTVIQWPVQTRALKPGEAHEPNVEQDAGWMLRNHERIRSFTVERARGDNPNIDCVVIAYTSTGATVAVAFESKALARAFLERPAFDGKGVTWFNSQQTIGEGEWDYQHTLRRIDEMAKLSARGRTELLRMSFEAEVPDDDLVTWRRTTEAYMSDGRILKKNDARFKPDSFRPEGRKHSYGWKDSGRMKPDLMKNPAALRAGLEKLRDSRKARGWSIEADNTSELPQSPLTGGGMGEGLDETKVRLSGGEYTLVRKNTDGTITVRNDNGDEFDSEPGETYTELAAAPARDPGPDPSKMSRGAFIAASKKAMQTVRQANLDKATAAIEAYYKSKGKTFPVGISPVQALLAAPRLSRDERQLRAAYNVAKQTVGVDYRGDERTWGAVWDRVNAKSEAVSACRPLSVEELREAYDRRVEGIRRHVTNLLQRDTFGDGDRVRELVSISKLDADDAKAVLAAAKKHLGPTGEGGSKGLVAAIAEILGESIDEGRISTPPYAYVMFNAAGGEIGTPAAWRTKAQYGAPGYGKPNEANLKKQIEGYNASLEPGGANDHLVDHYPKERMVAVGGLIRRNESGGETVARWGKVPSRYGPSESIVEADAEDEQVKQAFRDWLGGLAHLDSSGKHYRVREHRKTIGGPSPKSKPAPWGKLVKARFPDVQDFHKAAQEYARSVRGAKGYAESEIDEAEKTVKLWPENHRDVQDRQDEYSKAKRERAEAVRSNSSRRIRGQVSAQIPELPPRPLFPFAFEKDGTYVGLVLGGESEVPEGATVRWKHRADESIDEAVKLRLKKIDDEWIVQWVENGKVNDDKSYYTDDKQDAQDTMADMQRRIDASETTFQASNGILVEVSPPGFKGTVKAMKKHGDIDNPYALAWWMKGRGAKSTYKADGTKKKGAAESTDEGRQDARKQRWMAAFMDELTKLAPQIARNSAKWGDNATFHYNQGTDPKVAAERVSKLGESFAEERDILLALAPHLHTPRPLNEAVGVEAVEVMRISTRPKPTKEPVMSTLAVPSYDSSQYATYCVYSDGTVVRDQYRDGRQTRTVVAEVEPENLAGVNDALRAIVKSYAGKDSIADVLFTVSESVDEDVKRIKLGKSEWQIKSARRGNVNAPIQAHVYDKFNASKVWTATYKGGVVTYQLIGGKVEDRLPDEVMAAVESMLRSMAANLGKDESLNEEDWLGDWKTESDMQVAHTIIAQLGGGKFRAMTGAKDFVGSDKGVTFSIGRNEKGVNRVRITLEASDTYTVEFLSVRGGNVKVKSKAEDIYADMLQDVFTRHTGLYTSLGTMGRKPTNEAERPSLGDTVDEIMRAWAKEKPASGSHIVVGFIADGGGTWSYDARGKITSVERSRSGVPITREAKSSDIDNIEDAIQRGAFQIENRPINYKIGVKSSLPRWVLHQATGSPLAKPKDESEVEGIAYLTGDDAAKAVKEIGARHPANVAAWLRKNLKRLEREGGWQEGGEFEDDYESTAYHVQAGGEKYTVRVGDEMVVVMRGIVEHAPSSAVEEATPVPADTLSAIRKVLIQNAGRYFTVKQLAGAVNAPESDTLRAASRLVTQGTAQFKRGDGFSLAGHPEKLQLPAVKPTGSVASDQRTYDYTHSDAEKARKRRERIGLGEAVGYAVVRGSKDALEYWTGKSWTGDKAEAKFFETKEESDDEAIRLAGEADETTTSGAVGGFRSYPLGKKPRSPGNIGSVPDDIADVDDEDDTEDESLDEGLKVGDRVVYGTDPVKKGFPASNREIGTVVKLGESGGVTYATVKMPSGKKLTFAADDFTKIDETAKGATCAGCGEPWPCSDSKRKDISGRERAKHYVAKPKGKDESMGVGDTSIEVVKRKGKWFVVPPDGTREREFADRKSAVASAQALAKRENYTVVVTIGEAKGTDEGLDEKLTDFQIDIEWQNGAYVVAFPELRGPAGSGYQDEFRYDSLDAALTFAAAEAARQNFIVVVWNLKPGDTYNGITVPVVPPTSAAKLESLEIDSDRLEAFTLAAEAVELPSSTPVNYENGLFTVELPAPQAARIRELLAAC